MSDRINCRNCIHFNDLEHRCCLNDGKAIKKECYFTLSNRKPKGKDVVIKHLKTRIADLEAKLAESEEKYNATNRAYWELVEKQDNDFLQYEKLIGENNKLKQQLAEKEDFIKDLMTGRVKPVIPRIKEIEKQYQDKISFCIEQLEKVKENIKKCNYKDFGIMYQSDAIKQIDNQIKQLKEMK